MSLQDLIRSWFSKAGSAQESKRPDNDLVTIKTFANRYEADVAKSVLDGRDIPSFVSAGNIGGTAPYMALGAGGARLLVRRDHADRALQLLESVQDGRGPAEGQREDAPN